MLTIVSGDRVRFKTFDVRWGRFEHQEPFTAPEPFSGRGTTSVTQIVNGMRSVHTVVAHEALTRLMTR